MTDTPIDPRIVHVASELVVDLGPQAENDGNLEYVIDVIDAVDYANEMCDRDFAAGVKAARDAVEALAPTWAVKFYVNRPSNGEWIGCNGAHEEVDVLAAIDVLQPRGDNSA